ncbi:glycosyltransferase family A protein [Metabacillus halosaccharovorans]|uniref:glycosyltransferase family A protein n=1 Tax=Metabacillus halosaccharovorans TaxID=930124 RepID=UPI0034CD9FF9
MEQQEGRDDELLSIQEGLLEFENHFNQVLKENDGNSHPPYENNKEKEIAFAISLKSKTASRDWKVVQNNLSKTLKSILRNTDQHFRIIVAGHKKPTIKELDHEKITWITVKFAPPKGPNEYTRDKMRKRRAIISHLRNDNFKGYFMPLDSDDWIHHRFVEYIRSQPLSEALILEQGFFSNIRNNEVWIMKNFYRRCGSSALVYIDSNTNRKRYSVTVKAHPFIKENLKKIGLPYKLVKIPLVFRYFGHSDNNSILKGKLDTDFSALDCNATGEILEDWIYNYFKVID